MLIMDIKKSFSLSNFLLLEKNYDNTMNNALTEDCIYTQRDLYSIYEFYPL